MSAPGLDRRFTPQEYVAWVAEQDEKYEYHDGEVFAMAGGSPERALATANVIAELRVGLRPSGCKTYSSDLRVRLVASQRYVYPGVSVVCGEPEFAPDDALALVNPTLIVEVLTPSTEAFDLGTKATFYRELPSFDALLFVRQDRPLLTLYRRAGTLWEVEGRHGLDAEINVLGVPLALREVYDGISFDTA